MGGTTMYVADVDDLEELRWLRDEAEKTLRTNPSNEQARWDIEDIDERIEELSSQVEGEVTGGMEHV
ncbi:hypothetical protein PBI_TOAKA_78 [Mycobacterium phage Toaka]|nr:hypothetical protein PBI_TOAKA_78 [Mycobacterium phage Toaka]